MAKIPNITVKVKTVRLKEGEYTLDELAKEIAKRVYPLSRDGFLKIHERAITGITKLRTDEYPTEHIRKLQMS